MNPKDLKVGDLIQLTGVVIASLGDYKIRLNGGLENTYITQSEADQCEIITPSIPAQGEWKPKVGEVVSHYDTLQEEWDECKIIAIDLGDVWLHHIKYPDMAS